MFPTSGNVSQMSTNLANAEQCQHFSIRISNEKGRRYNECVLFKTEVQSSALWRSRRELSNSYLLAKFRFDTAENEPCTVCRTPMSNARCRAARQAGGGGGARGRAVAMLVLPASAATSSADARRSLAAALLDRANLTGLVLGCIEAKFCKKICV